MRDLLLIGLGNDARGDDAAGLEVARRLRGAPGVHVMELGGDPLALLDAWDGASSVVVVDAVRSGAPAGTVHRLDAREAPLSAALGGASSTHAVGLADAIELARALGRLPERLVVLGIEGRRFGSGDRPSPEVVEAIERVSRSLSARRPRAATAARPRR